MKWFFFIDYIFLLKFSFLIQLQLRQVSLNLENSEIKTNHLNDVRESLFNTQKTQIKLVNAIENFPELDRDLLMLKSTSYSSIMSLESSFSVLQNLNDLE